MGQYDNNLRADTDFGEFRYIYLPGGYDIFNYSTFGFCEGKCMPAFLDPIEHQIFLCGDGHQILLIQVNVDFNWV